MVAHNSEKKNSKVSSRKGMFSLNFQILLAFAAAELDVIQAFSLI